MPVFSKRSLKNGGIEVKLRKESSSRIVPLDEAVRALGDEVRQEIADFLFCRHSPHD